MAIESDSSGWRGWQARALHQMRQRHFRQYLRHKDPQTLKEHSPFVWYEPHRQGLL